MKSLLAKLFPCFFAGEQHICDRLPEELWTDIFGRLPSNSLLQCILVCKPWRRLITSPSFVSAHLARTLGASTAGGNRQSLLLCYSSGRKKFLRFDDRDFPHHSEALVPPVAASSTLTVVGTCNGLVCLSDRSTPGARNLVLWNPHISKSLTLPPPGERDLEVDPPSLQVLSTGFGIGSGADDFKVLTVAAASSSSKGGNFIPLVSDLYSLRTGSWKRIPSGTPNYELNTNQNLAFASGRLHGIAQTESMNLVLVFDLTTETYSEIMLPKCLTEVPTLELSVKAFGDSPSTIAVVRTDRRVLRTPMELIRVQNFQIWVMSRYGEAESWDQAYDGVPLQAPSMASLLAFRRNEEAFMELYPSSTIYTLKLKGSTRNSVEHLSGLSGTIDTYVKSIALLDKGKGIDLNRYPRRPSWVSSAASWCVDALRALVKLPMNLIMALGGFLLEIIKFVFLVMCTDPACWNAFFQACFEVLVTAIFEACCGALVS